MTLQTLAQATIRARAASGVEVCTRARRGLVQVGYFLGRTFIDLSDWISIPAAIDVLRDIERDRGFR
jgi:hypothetical protein